MAVSSKPLPLPRSAVIYITAGAITIVWCAIWIVYLSNNPPNTNTTYYWCFGFLLSGVMLALIGLGIGRLSRIERPGHQVVPPPVPLPPEAELHELVYEDELPAFASANQEQTPSFGTNGEAPAVSRGFLPAKSIQGT